MYANSSTSCLLLIPSFNERSSTSKSPSFPPKSFWSTYTSADPDATTSKPSSIGSFSPATKVCRFSAFATDTSASDGAVQNTRRLRRRSNRDLSSASLLRAARAEAESASSSWRPAPLASRASAYISAGLGAVSPMDSVETRGDPTAAEATTDVRCTNRANAFSTRDTISSRTGTGASKLEASVCWYASRKEASHKPCVRRYSKSPPIFTESHPGTGAPAAWPPSTRRSQIPSWSCVRSSPCMGKKSKSPLCVTYISMRSWCSTVHAPFFDRRQSCNRRGGLKRWGCDSAAVGTEDVAKRVCPMKIEVRRESASRRRRTRLIAQLVMLRRSCHTASRHANARTSAGANAERFDGTYRARSAATRVRNPGSSVTIPPD
mmetsp:Transcript_16008/g.52397  ORF Transcript_16008/g.52397 Transcript_16008/m.52397 type:complete len:377 (+) Transcript_16008:6024-7154(+)